MTQPNEKARREHNQRVLREWQNKGACKPRNSVKVPYAPHLDLVKHIGKTMNKGSAKLTLVDDNT